MKAIKAVVFGIACLLAGSAIAADLTIYVKPDGNDSASGATQSEAVASLQMGVKRALADAAAGASARRIVILPGKYLEQTTVVENLPDDKPLIITGSSGAGVRPVFDGNGKGRAWLQLDAALGKPSRLTIEGVEVANYVTAVSLNGKRTSPDEFNGENVIRQNVFRDIGQIALPSGKPSTAAVRLVNSRNNRIVQNRFFNIRNNTGCGALHAIYIAHYSSGNLIEGNTFEGGCGTAVKTRDASNANIIRGNKFIDQSEPLFLDSFCNKDARDDCTKESSECPSWNNEFKDNTAARLGPKAQKKPTQVAGTDTVSGCPAAPAAGTRLRESNTRSER